MLLTAALLAAVGGSAMFFLRHRHVAAQTIAIAAERGASEPSDFCEITGTSDELVIVGRGAARGSGAARRVQAAADSPDPRTAREIETTARNSAVAELAVRLEALAHDAHRWGSAVADRSADEWRALAARVLETAPRSATHHVDPYDAQRLLGDVTYRIDLDSLGRYVQSSSRSGGMIINPIAGAGITVATFFLAYLLLRGVTRRAARRNGATPPR